jgi:hypothetical protein
MNGKSFGGNTFVQAMDFINLRLVVKKMTLVLKESFGLFGFWRSCFNKSEKREYKINLLPW